MINSALSLQGEKCQQRRPPTTSSRRSQSVSSTRSLSTSSNKSAHVLNKKNIDLNEDIYKEMSLSSSGVESSCGSLMSIPETSSTRQEVKQRLTEQKCFKEWTSNDIKLMLFDKIDQHACKGTDRFRQAFQLFTKTGGITIYDFDRTLRRLEVYLPEDNLKKIFDEFDTNKSGDISLSELSNMIFDAEMDEEVAFTDFGVKNEAPQNLQGYTDRARIELEKKDNREKLKNLAIRSVQHSWRIEDIEQRLREKIDQRTSKSSDCFRQALRIFKKTSGINLYDFQKALIGIGLLLTKDQLKQLFQRYDADNSGDIDLKEFINGIVPTDYTNQKCAAFTDETSEKKKKQTTKAKKQDYFNEIISKSWTLDKIEERLRAKIEQRTSRSSDTFRQAWKIFHKSNGISRDDFAASLNDLGFFLSSFQREALFKRYDTDNSNTIDLQEFCQRVLPCDYVNGGELMFRSKNIMEERRESKFDSLEMNPNRNYSPIQIVTEEDIESMKQSSNEMDRIRHPEAVSNSRPQTSSRKRSILHNSMHHMASAPKVEKKYDEMSTLSSTRVKKPTAPSITGPLLGPAIYSPRRNVNIRKRITISRRQNNCSFGGKNLLINSK